MINKYCNQCGRQYGSHKSNHRKYCSIKCARMNWASYRKGIKVSQETRNKISASVKKYIKENNPKHIFKNGYVPQHAGVRGSRTGVNNGMWKGKVKKICCMCHKEYEVYPVHENTTKYCSKICLWMSMLGKKQNPEVTKKRIEKTSGENHYNFKNWRSREPYGQGWSKSLKESIRQRDSYKCQICGVPEEECFTALSVHHIDNVKKNLSPSNLISLCKKCHGKVHLNKITLKIREVSQ